MVLPVASLTLGSKHRAGKTLWNVDELNFTMPFVLSVVLSSY